MTFKYMQTKIFTAILAIVLATTMMTSTLNNAVAQNPIEDITEFFANVTGGGDNNTKPVSNETVEETPVAEENGTVKPETNDTGTIVCIQAPCGPFPENVTTEVTASGETPSLDIVQQGLLEVFKVNLAKQDAFQLTDVQVNTIEAAIAALEGGQPLVPSTPGNETIPPVVVNITETPVVNETGNEVPPVVVNVTGNETTPEPVVVPPVNETEVPVVNDTVVIPPADNGTVGPVVNETIEGVPHINDTVVPPVENGNVTTENGTIPGESVIGGNETAPVVCPPIVTEPPIEVVPGNVTTGDNGTVVLPDDVPVIVPGNDTGEVITVIENVTEAVENVTEVAENVTGTETPAVTSVIQIDLTKEIGDGFLTLLQVAQYIPSITGEEVASLTAAFNSLQQALNDAVTASGNINIEQSNVASGNGDITQSNVVNSGLFDDNSQAGFYDAAARRGR